MFMKVMEKVTIPRYNYPYFNMRSKDNYYHAIKSLTKWNTPRIIIKMPTKDKPTII